MEPEFLVVLAVAFVFGLLCALAPHSVIRAARALSAKAGAEKRRLSRGRTRALRFLGVVIALGVPAFTYLSRGDL
ncbi:hypothetical protein [Streptomyces sulphureus]|uniref:hypothetical protein n=1 Tax=Streptomyces sulphureus TaxID=47758 RepID=UPI0003786C85|nr:hypothetical protein [Streptomyces sulphureus]